MKRIQGSDEHLRASMENPFIHDWGTIIHGCERSTNGMQQVRSNHAIQMCFGGAVKLLINNAM